jgi:periplasmic protein CpxP/Spy
MKASQFAGPATVFLLAATLAGAPGSTAFAATPAANDQTPNAAATNGMPNNGATGAAPGAATTAPSSQAAVPNGQPQTLEQMAEQRITDLHQRLNITAKQQTSWDKFARVMRENARQLDQAYQQRAQQFDSMNAVEDMRSYAKIERMRARDVEKLVPAFQSLYASLSPEQKQTADALFRNRAEAAQQQHQNATANR